MICWLRFVGYHPVLLYFWHDVAIFINAFGVEKMHVSFYQQL